MLFVIVCGISFKKVTSVIRGYIRHCWVSNTRGTFIGYIDMGRNLAAFLKWIFNVVECDNITDVSLSTERLYYIVFRLHSRLTAASGTG